MLRRLSPRTRILSQAERVQVRYRRLINYTRCLDTRQTFTPTPLNDVNDIGAGSAGAARTVRNASRIRDAFTERAIARGNVTVNPAGAVCCATKVNGTTVGLYVGRFRRPEPDGITRRPIGSSLFCRFVFRAEILRDQQRHVPERSHLRQPARRRRELQVSLRRRIHRTQL